MIRHIGCAHPSKLIFLKDGWAQLQQRDRSNVNATTSSDSIANDPSRNAAELERRYQLAFRIVVGVIVSSLALVILAFLLAPSVQVVAPSRDLIVALWLVMVVSALGVVVYRRAKFSAVRLQAIARARGASGLLATLQHTTVIIALICLGIAALGFTVTMLSGDLDPPWRARVVHGAVIAVLLLYAARPSRAAWQRLIDKADFSDQTTP